MISLISQIGLLPLFIGHFMIVNRSASIEEFQSISSIGALQTCTIQLLKQVGFLISHEVNQLIKSEPVVIKLVAILILQLRVMKQNEFSNIQLLYSQTLLLIKIILALLSRTPQV